MRHIVMLGGVMLLAAAPLRAAITRAPAGSPERARQIVEQVRASWDREQLERTRMLATLRTPAPAVPDDAGTWLRMGVPDLAGHAAIYDPLRDRMLVYGGMDNYEQHFDLWELSMTAPHPWSTLEATGGPAPQPGSAVYDPVRDRMIIVAGWWADDATNDVWALSLAGPLEWTRLNVTGPKPDEVGPVVYDSLRDRLVMTNGGPSVWTFSLSGAPEWTEITTTGTTIGSRARPVAIYDPVRDRVVLCGGEADDINIYLEIVDAWSLSLSGTPTWTELTVAGPPPGWRVAATAIYDPVNDRMVLYAGTNWWTNLGDAWSLSLDDTPAWTLLETPGPARVPYVRSFHTAVYDSARERMVIFSGWGWKHGPPDRPDVWALALTGDPVWSPVRGTAPEPRAHHAAIYDPDNDRMLIFGGGDFNSSYDASNELWACSLDERPTWTELHPSGPAPASEYPVMLYDDIHHRAIVITGTDVFGLSLRGGLRWMKIAARGTGPAQIKSAIVDSRRHRIVALTADNAPWELSLSGAPKWKPIDALADQPVPGGEVAIYDRARDRLLIWGESSNQELWALPLSSSHPRWTRLATSGPAPSDRWGYSLILDTARDRLVMYRGHTHAGDAWYPWALPLSEPLQWGPLVTSGGTPFTEDSHSAIYDPVRDRMVVFGGEYFYNSFNELWALQWGGATPLAATRSKPAAVLQPAYPNPFNPRVTIPFELASDGAATLAIYDVAGRLVKTLVDEWTPRGSHAVTWEGNSDTGAPVSSGIYFCRLHTAGVTETRKLVMLK